MINPQGITKENVVIGLVIAVWAVILMVVLSIFGIMQMWPAFLVMLLFFETGANPKNLINIMVGGIVGLGLAYVVPKIVAAWTPSLTVGGAILLLVFLVISIVIALKDFLPIVFNNYLMLYWTVAGIIPEQDTAKWMLTLVLGGLLVVGGIIGTLRLLAGRQPEQTLSE
jgi:hypothetical protein